MLNLFPDQTEIMNELRGSMHSHKSILVQAATGSGKTIMGTDMVMTAVEKNLQRKNNKKVLFSVPRRDLLTQTSDTFTKHGVNHSFIANGREYNPYAPVYIGMVDTMARRLDKLPRFSMALFDETHYGAEALGSVISAIQKQGAWTVGLSATPWKMNGQGLGVWYKHMIQGKSIRWLINNKRLSEYRYFYGKTHLDLSQIGTVGGDYNKGQLASFMESESKRVIIGDCVSDYRKRCMGRIHIVRCTSIKHSELTAQAFRDAGIPAVHVDGTTKDSDKYQIFRDFALRQILVLTFADLLNFGFDLSQASGMDVCIESGSDQKPSKSLAGQMQFWGRMLRYKPYAAIINDHVNNWKEHQLPCTERAWTLKGRPKKSDGEKSPPMKQCDICFYVHPPAPQCPECGYIYEINSRKLQEVDGELVEMNIDEHQSITDGFSGILPPTPDQETLEYLIKLAQREGKKNPVAWAAKELAKRMNKEYV